MPLTTSGTCVGPYRILRRLGEGGSGAVYEAEVIAPGGAGRLPRGARVALKELANLDLMDQLNREFNALRFLSHPALPRYYDCFQEGSRGYLIMEFVPGHTFEALPRIHARPLREPEVLEVARQLCDVLSYLHEQVPPILHRDIKPANVLLTPTGWLKLVDFGLLKQGTERTRYIIRGLGTMAYAPLEQYGSLGTDPRTDLYSLGATLYHLLTGREPPAAADRAAHAPDDLLQPPDVYVPGVSGPLRAALLKAMAIRPDARFASIAAFRSALLGDPAVPPGSPRSAASPHPPGPAPAATALLRVPPAGRGATGPSMEDQPTRPLAAPPLPPAGASVTYATCPDCKASVKQERLEQHRTRRCPQRAPIPPPPKVETRLVPQAAPPPAPSPRTLAPTGTSQMRQPCPYCLERIPANQLTTHVARVHPGTRPPVARIPDPPRPAPRTGQALTPGDRVRHPTFGVGTVTTVLGSSADAEVRVCFADGNVKRLMVGLAKLEWA